MGLLVAIAVAILSWALGRAALPLLAPPGREPIGHRLHMELLLGNIVLSLAGLLLAEVGSFTPGRCVALATVAAGIAALAGRRRAAGHWPYEAADAAGLALLVVAFAYVAPAFDTTLYGADSSTYLATGVHIARHGSFVFHDPTVADLSPAQRRELFLSYKRGTGAPPFVRVAGGLLLPDLDTDRVMPAFHPLLSVWVALFYGLGGDPAIAVAITYFGAFAIWALAAFVASLAGPAAAAMGIGLLACLAPQYWYSRFAMPEIPSQYFLWAGLCAGGLGARQGRRGLVHLGGLAVGATALMRLDMLAHLAVVLALWLACAPRASWPRSPAFLFGLAATGGYAIGHQSLFPTHYGAEAAGYIVGASRLVAHPPSSLALALAIIAVAGVAVALRRRAPARALAAAVVRLAAGGAGAAALASVFVASKPDIDASLGWLTMFLGLPLLALVLPGGWLWARWSADAGQRLALLLGVVAAAQLVYDPRVSPAPLWAIRRFVPIVMPVLVIAAAVSLERLRRWRGAVALAAAALVVAGTGSHLALAYRSPAYDSSLVHVRALGALLAPGAVIIGDPNAFNQTQLHLALWATRDTPAYLLGGDSTAQIRALRAALHNRPLYWIGPAENHPIAGESLQYRLVGTYRFRVKARRMEWYDERDDLAYRELTLAVYTVE